MLYSYDDYLIVPGYSDLGTRKDVSLRSRLTRNIHLSLPIVSAPMDTVSGAEMVSFLASTGAAGILHRYCSPEQQLDMLNRALESAVVPQNIGIAVGIRLDDLLARIRLMGHLVGFFCIDVAHAHHKGALEALDLIKQKCPDVDVLVGNIATVEAAEFFLDRDITPDGLRVGIGNGALCSTRIETGVGVPQASCVFHIAEFLKKNNYDVPVCADGGIRYPGDAAKAIALGASTVMCGSVLAGTFESPGDIMVEGFGPKETKYKMYRGMASADAKKADGRPAEHVEGISKRVPYKGSALDVLQRFRDGLKSSFSYVGASNVHQFQQDAQLALVSSTSNHIHKFNGV